MLLTLTNTTQPARDLGFLLRKHPDRCQVFELPMGSAHVFYPEASDQRCTVAMLLDIDPVALVRGRSNAAGGGPFDAYVNDRPYAASSFTSVAIARVFGPALGGRSDRPELVGRKLQLEAVITPIRCEEPDLPGRLFEPLGYRVEATFVPGRGTNSRSSLYQRLSLTAETTLRDLLVHLYVLVPVLDRQKHYWVGDDEVEKLFRFGEEWLPTHPEREFITRSYLKRAPILVRAALERLTALEERPSDEARSGGIGATEASMERPMRLQERRVERAVAVLCEANVKTIVDLGCGAGDLVEALARHSNVERIVGMDVDSRELDRAKARLARAPLPTARREAIEFVHSSVLYADGRMTDFEAATALEVIEHIDIDRLPTFERVLFAEMHPRLVVVTTPNRDYNALFSTLLHGEFRHADHRFEWDRAEFGQWVERIARQCGYSGTIDGIGDADPACGSPTQIAVFRCN